MKHIELGDGSTPDDLLGRLNRGGKWMLVEHDGEPLRRSDLATTTLADGDQLELVRAVAGGCA